MIITYEYILALWECENPNNKTTFFNGSHNSGAGSAQITNPTIVVTM